MKKPSINLGRFRTPLLFALALLPIVMLPAAAAAAILTRQVHADNLTRMHAFTATAQRAVTHPFNRNDFESLQEIVGYLAPLSGGRTVRVLNRDGDVLASSNRDEVGVRLSNESPQCRFCHIGARSPETPLPADVYYPETRLIATALRLENQVTCQGCHPAGADSLGVILVEHDAVPTQTREAYLGRLMLGGAGGLYLALLGLAWLGYERLAARPLRSLLSPERRASGDQPLHAETPADDFGRLARRLDDLNHDLQLNRRGLETQRAQVEALLSLTEWIDVTASKQKTLKFAIGKIQQVTGFSTVAMRLLDSDNRCFTLAAQQGMTPRMIEELSSIPMDFGFFKDICATRRAAYTSDLANDPRLAGRSPLEIGVVSLVSVPLLSGDRIMGSMELVSNQPYAWTVEEIRWLELVGRSLGNGLHHIETSQRLQNLAVIQERGLIAQEMHDGLAQMLNSMRLWAENARSALDDDDLQAVRLSLGNIDRTARDASTGLRDEILGLRSAIPPGEGLPAVIRDYLSRYQRQWGIRTELIAEQSAEQAAEPATLADAARRPAQAVEIQLLRILQECLTNIRRHANASSVRVTLKEDAARLRAEVHDDGQGFDPSSVSDERLGLRIMRERAAGVGGRITVDSAPGRGTRIVVDIPKPVEVTAIHD